MRLAVKLVDAPLAWAELFTDEGSRFLAQRGLPSGLDQGLIDRANITASDVAAVGTAESIRSPEGLNIASWAAAALRLSNDQVVGVLAVADTQPRMWSDAEQNDLVDLAAGLSGSIVAQLERARREQLDAQYHELLNLATVGPMVILRWEYTNEWHISYASANLLNQFGYDPQDLISKRVAYRSLLHPDDVERVTQEVQDYLQAGVDSFYQQYRLRHADGTYRLVDEYTLLLHDTDGSPRYYYGYIYDVTERGEAEETLHHINKRLKSILDSDTAYITRTDMEGRFTFVNRHFVQLIQRAYQREMALIGADSFETVVPEDRDLTLETVKQCIAQPGKPFQVILRKPNPEGGYFHTLWEFVAVVDDQNVPVEIQCVGFDITLLIRAQEELRRTNAQLESIIRGDALYITRTDIAARYTFINERFRRVLNIAYPEMHDQFIGRNSMETIVPQDHEVTLQTVKQCIASPNTPHQVVLRKRHPAGDHFYTLWEFTGIPDAGGQVVEIQCVGFDITELIQTQQLLSEREERYRFIFENTLDSIILHAPDGSVLYSNGAAFDTGYTAEEVMAMSPAELAALIHPDDLPRVQAESIKHMAEGRTEALYTYRMVRKDGTSFWVENHVRYLRDPEGRLTGIITVSRDVDERVKAQEALRRNEARYRKLTQMLSDFVFEATFAEDGTLFLSWLEGEYEKVTGYPLETAAEMWPMLSVHPDDAERTAADLRRTAAGEYVASEERILHAQGHYVWVRVARLPIVDSSSERVIGYYGVVQDISAEKNEAALKAEQDRLRANLRHEETLNQTIRRVVSAISHDVRTPLAVISTSKDMLSRYYERLTEERRSAAFDTIDKQLAYVSRMLDDLSKIVKGVLIEGQLELKATNLRTLCQVTVDELKQTIGQKHRLVFDADWQHELVMVDETLIQRILFNLLSNAIKFSPEGSRITLRLAQNERQTVLQVSDEGIGIPSEDQARIFDMFYRAENAQQVAGTGVGLSIVKECVERHAGRVFVESQVGVGTTFTVELPLLLEQAQRSANLTD